MASQDLATYLATAATGAPATTAASLIFELDPKLTADGQYLAAETDDVDTLVATQAKYGNVLYPQPPETPMGINMSGIVALLTQATKDILARLPALLSVTTNGSGVLTVDLTSFNLDNVPVVLCQVQNPAANVTPIVCDITALTATSLSILTQDAATSTPIGVTVYIAVHPVITL